MLYGKVYVEFGDLWEYNEDNDWVGALNCCCALPRAWQGVGAASRPFRSAGAKETEKLPRAAQPPNPSLRCAGARSKSDFLLC